jgi:hypothetical protein
MSTTTAAAQPILTVVKDEFTEVLTVLPSPNPLTGTLLSLKNLYSKLWRRLLLLPRRFDMD